MSVSKKDQKESLEQNKWKLKLSIQFSEAFTISARYWQVEI
jgi:hypothetical protein